jgi:hypothetical protein
VELYRIRLALGWASQVGFWLHLCFWDNSMTDAMFKVVSEWMERGVSVREGKISHENPTPYLNKLKSNN